MTDAGMIFVPAGRYKVGCDDGADAERPRREIALCAFRIDATPVHNRAFDAFVSATGYITEAERRGSAWSWSEGAYHEVPGASWRSCATGDRREHPVVLVTWRDAAAYAAWRGARLPTEWEWEAAAQGGLNRLFPWGPNSPDGSQCNWAQKPSSAPPTTPVTRFPPNDFGLYDMVGNVWQWCQNEFDADGALRARRGGAWNVVQDFRLRCSNRGALPPDACAPNLGFRCASSVTSH